MPQHFRTPSQIVAYHEAGHAVMAMALGFSVSEISSIPTETSRGHTDWSPPTEMTLEARIGVVLVYASGMAADFLHWNSASDRDQDPHSRGHNDDRHRAFVHLSALEQHDAFNDYAMLAASYLRRPEVWELVVFFAQILEEFGAINGQDVLRRAKEHVPKISSAELLQFKDVVDLSIRHKSQGNTD
ncbi:hypothetical protein [Paracidovorax avenae]|uniref:hypothetical protein n=1 Tax=Paracidovorax avenae TaxID=80867 RepID=UPI000D7216B6|nr:hypothetical protein [Paracidovorax avenae]